MRRTITILAALGLVFAGSCERIEEGLVLEGPDVIEGEVLTVEASFGDFPDTKTSVQSDGKSIFWTPGDAINLFFGDISSAKFTTPSSMTEPSATASFTGTLGAATGSSGDGFVAPTFWGVYPYDAANNCNGSSVTLTIKSEQTAVAGSFGQGMSPSVANAPGLGLSFKNVGSWFKFSVSQEGITAATFEGNNGEILAGKVTVTMDSDGNPLITNVADGVTRITVTPEGGGSFVPNQYYYITLIPQTISGTTGYTLTFYKGGYVSNLVVADPSKTYAFARSNSRSKTNADAGLEWKPDYVEMAEGFKWARRNVGATAPQGYGNYFAWGETSPKSSYTDSNYDYLLAFGDAATANWGEDWRTPTSAEWDDLLNTNKYTWEKTTENGVNGYRVTSKVTGYVGNSIFLPAAGYCYSAAIFHGGSNGYYWSSTPGTNDSGGAKALHFSTYRGTYEYYRSVGHTIRAIYDPSFVPPVSPEVPVTGVSFDMETYAVLDKGTCALTGTISPSNATIQDLTWVSSNPSVAIVSPTGVVTGKSVGTTTITTRTVDGGYMASCTVTVIPNTSYIDMGNGTKWATVNVGANSPEEYGGYFAWGETQTKTGSYNWSTYQYCTGGSENTINKYTPTDGKTVLEAGDDAATVNLGSNWRMATDAEWTWLLEHCTWTWCEMNGVKGSLVTSNVTGDGNTSIFLPAAGNKLLNQTANVGTRGRYWTSSASDLKSWSVDISSDGPIHESAQRIRGYSVRAVYEPHLFINGHEYVEMGDGLKWATCNVGAATPEDYGDYFSWGETTTKSSYNWSTYFDNPTGDGETFTKYALDKKTQLDLSDDAARANWGGTWRMPTDAEWEALLNTINFDWAWDDVRKGYKVTSKVSGYEGNSIFLPATGRIISTGTGINSAGSSGNYWSSSLHESYSKYARDVYFESERVRRSFDGRHGGHTVRSVSE